MSQAPGISASRGMAYNRLSMFAIEVVDAITLERITSGVKFTVEGLNHAPTQNASGLKVWGKEEATRLRRVTIDPQKLPYEAIELSPDDIAELVQAASSGQALIKTVQLPPGDGEPVPANLTVYRGALLEGASTPVPVPGAAASLEWLDGTNWNSIDTEFPIRSASGTFIIVLRIPPEHLPPLDQDGNATVRLRVRIGAERRRSLPLQLAWGKANTAPSPFFWRDLYLYP